MAQQQLGWIGQSSLYERPLKSNQERSNLIKLLSYKKLGPGQRQSDEQWKQPPKGGWVNRALCGPVSRTKSIGNAIWVITHLQSEDYNHEKTNTIL